MAFKPHGIVVPIVTPVTQDGKFNEKAYRDLIEYLASRGIHGVFPFGTTGEFYAHDMGFYREVLAVTKDAVRGRMDIYAGANNITTRGAVEIAKAVEQVGGIDALSVLTPHVRQSDAVRGVRILPRNRLRDESADYHLQ